MDVRFGAKPIDRSIDRDLNVGDWLPLPSTSLSSILVIARRPKRDDAPVVQRCAACNANRQRRSRPQNDKG